MSEQYISTGRKRQKRKTRKNILLSAQKLLASGNDFTLENVAADASISRATIYRYYSSVEVLSAEAGLDLNTKSPESVYRELDGLDLESVVLGVQNYFNHLALDNEPAFRKYLSVVLTSSADAGQRGARRIKTMELALSKNHSKLNKTELQNLSRIASVLMGIEPVIVSKDVCRLDNQESLELLNWGLKMLLRGIGYSRTTDQDQLPG
ncbi:MAG: TetR/AcrR family transcriptional regulator [Eudoraea sp.]|nr:TetR/AcrR family transcriptional regulator [Eudoraea sp.]